MMKKAQIWGFDMMMASIILVFGIFVFYFYALNYSGDSSDKIDSLFYDAEIVSEKILSEGYPPYWNSTNVIVPGILTDGRIDQTKLELFYNMTETSIGGDFDEMRMLLNTKYNFWFTISGTENFEIRQATGDPIDIEGIGREYSSEDVANLVKYSRVVIYHNRTKSIDFYMWE